MSRRATVVDGIIERNEMVRRRLTLRRPSRLFDFGNHQRTTRYSPQSFEMTERRPLTANERQMRFRARLGAVAQVLEPQTHNLGLEIGISCWSR